MKKKFMLTALIVFATLIARNEGFVRCRCGGQEITSGIVHALGWKLSNELLVLEITRLTSSSSQATPPSISASFLSFVRRFFLV